MNDRIPELLKKANSLPDKPGVYKMYDSKKMIIYVGKAKNLKNRVTSYFRGTHDGKTAALVDNIDNFEIIITDSEYNALLTECSLIKLHKPFYNILLKDGKGYPFICVREEKGWPVVEIANNRKKVNSRYFGPFVQRQKATLVVEMLKNAFSLPRCSFNGRKPDRVCLEYHIKRCRGFCMDGFDQDETRKIIDNMYSILDGKIDNISDKMRDEMEYAAEILNFEYAAIIRDRLRSLDIIKNKQKPLVSQNRNADYISYAESSLVSDEAERDAVAGFDNVEIKQILHTCIFMLRIRNGYVVGERCDIFDEGFTSELLEQYITGFYSQETAPDGKIYIKGDYEWMPLLNEWLKDKIVAPTFSQDEKLVEVARQNASERLLLLEGKTRKGQRLLASFCDFSGIRKADIIEAYDISSIAGTDVVCGMISCVGGNLMKKNYKKFKIEKTMGNDDTAYMREAVLRRLKRFNDGDESFAPLPDVIICDGGLGQIHAVEAAVSEAKCKILVVGLKKDSRHRTKAIVFSDGRELNLSEKPEVFSFCGNLQEEVHRFAISYHKTLRDKFFLQSELLNINGVGKKKARALFLKFKSVDKIKNASIGELTEVEGVNEKLAAEIKNYLCTNN